MNKKLFLSFEFIVLFLLLPLLVFYFRHGIKYFVIPSIGIIAIISFFYLRKNKSFDRKLFFSLTNLRVAIEGILTRFFLGGIVITLFAYFFLPDKFLMFPKEHFALWIIVMMVYPLISVYAQEVIFHALFFFRYRSIFSTHSRMILINGIAFGLWHLLFGNWIAPILSIAGGIMFA